MFLAVFSLFLAGYPARTPALGTETFGNEPLREPAYEEWPNLSLVINDTSRVYQCWVNGGEKFCFRGDTEALNEALQRFALVKAYAHEVVLLPGPASVSSLTREKKYGYDWSLEINAGLSRIITRGKGGLIWTKDPRLTVFIGGGNVVLEKLHVPKGVRVLELADLRERYTQAVLESEDIQVRGWGACELARLDPFSTQSVLTVTRLLNDTNEWVRLNAVSALESFGVTAASSIPALKRTAETADRGLRERAEQAIAAIVSATNSPAADRRRSEILERISLFRRSLPQAN